MHNTVIFVSFYKYICSHLGFHVIGGYHIMCLHFHRDAGILHKMPRYCYFTYIIYSLCQIPWGQGKLHRLPSVCFLVSMSMIFYANMVRVSCWMKMSPSALCHREAFSIVFVIDPVHPFKITSTLLSSFNVAHLLVRLPFPSLPVH